MYVMCRVTSVNRALSSQSGDVASSELCVIQLILNLNLNAARLQQILQGIYSTYIHVYVHIHTCTYCTFYREYSVKGTLVLILVCDGLIRH